MNAARTITAVLLVAAPAHAATAAVIRRENVVQLITDVYPIIIGTDVPCRYLGADLTTVLCDVGRDVGGVYGGPGTDFIVEATELSGDDGPYGEWGDYDRLYGGPGDDLLAGHPIQLPTNHDRLDGGADFDTCGVSRHVTNCEGS